MRSYRDTLHRIGDRLRGYLYLTALLVMTAALWAAAWAQSLERDFDRGWMSPAWVGVIEVDDTDADYPRFNAGTASTADPDWDFDLDQSHVATTRPVTDEPALAGVDSEP